VSWKKIGLLTADLKTITEAKGGPGGGPWDGGRGGAPAPSASSSTS
jgi:hypothetical protein